MWSPRCHSPGRLVSNYHKHFDSLCIITVARTSVAYTSWPMANTRITLDTQIIMIEGVNTEGATGRNCVGINPIVSLLQSRMEIISITS